MLSKKDIVYFTYRSWSLSFNTIILNIISGPSDVFIVPGLLQTLLSTRGYLSMIRFKFLQKMTKHQKNCGLLH